MYGLNAGQDTDRTPAITRSAMPHLRNLAELLGHESLLRRGRPQTFDRTPSLQARVSEAFRTRYLGCFLAECDPETGSRSVA